MLIQKTEEPNHFSIHIYSFLPTPFIPSFKIHSLIQSFAHSKLTFTPSPPPTAPRPSALPKVAKACTLLALPAWIAALN